MLKFLVVGAGFSGTVLSREIAEAMPCEILVIDARDHIGGNCHTERDIRSGVMVHKYGPHIFNTNDESIWHYINKFTKMMPFVNRVKAVTPRGVFSMPINLLTINQFFGRSMSPNEARQFIASHGDSSIQEPKNLEEQALKMLGRELYENFFKGYTIKQWGCDPKQLPASVFKRLPVRFNYDDNYYDKKHQGIPEHGYTDIMEKIIDHPRIRVELNRQFRHEDTKKYNHVFYTAPLDAFFGFIDGRLSYRTVTFERIDAKGDFQGNAVINYTSTEVPFTRIHEHKHFAPWENHDATVAFREYSKDAEFEDVLCYPKRIELDKQRLMRYRSDALNIDSFSFFGRLATYRYLDMEAVIREAIELAKSFINAYLTKKKPPVFSNKEE